MSADNWAVCWQCYDSQNQVQDEEDEEAMDEFTTFREDYEFYTNSRGELEISYSGVCTVCGLQHHINETRPYYTRNPPPHGELEIPL